MQSYIDYLEHSHSIDPSLLKAQNAEMSSFIGTESSSDSDQKTKALVVAIDEAQNFTPLELATVIDAIKAQHSGKQITLYIARDGNQSIDDPFDLTIHALPGLTEKPIGDIFDLNISYRTPPIVTELANRFLKIKTQVIGGALHKIDTTSSAATTNSSNSNLFSSMVEREGYVRWQMLIPKPLARLLLQLPPLQPLVHLMQIAPQS